MYVSILFCLSRSDINSNILFSLLDCKSLIVFLFNLNSPVFTSLSQEVCHVGNTNFRANNLILFRSLSPIKYILSASLLALLTILVYVIYGHNSEGSKSPSSYSKTKGTFITYIYRHSTLHHMQVQLPFNAWKHALKAGIGQSSITYIFLNN